MNTKHVDGLTVVSIGTGERLGRVVEPVLDDEGRKILAFAVQTGGTGLLPIEPPAMSWLAAENVRSIGPDALTVDDASCLREFEPQTESLRVNSLIKLPVMTEGGTAVGPVASLDFDERRMAVTDLEVSAGFFKANRMVPIDQVIRIGQELIVVSDAVCAQPDDRDGGDADADSEHRRIVGDVEPVSADA